MNINGLPLNGTRTHPLKPASLAVLYRLSSGEPIPYSQLNAGVIDRLTREGLAEIIEMPNPFQTKAKLVRGLQITEVGRGRLKSLRTV